LAHEDLVRKAAQGGIDLYFAGDSITRRWGTSDAQYKDFLANWTTNFFGWNAGNFGWGGDKVQNVLWRLQHGELDGVRPKVIVLLAGTNDLGDGAATTDLAAREEDVVQGIGAILNLMREKAPGATIILMGITPRADRSAMAAAIDRTNRRLAQLADGRAIRFLNLTDRLTTPDGRLREGVTVDGLHLSIAGYQIWADALKPLLTELLGPSAKTDHAPPPTGDPSAQKPAAPAK
jgi:lysophospholipase L1-like esterase